MSTKPPEPGSILVAMRSNMYLSDPIEPYDEDGDPWDTIFVSKGDCVMFCEERVRPTHIDAFERVEWIVLYEGGVYAHIFTRKKEEYGGLPQPINWNDKAGLDGAWSVLSGPSDP